MKIELLKSQKILLQMKTDKVQEALKLTRARQDELRVTLGLVMIEQGVPKEEVAQWHLTKDGQAVEKK